jgi:hypothetical protein
MHLGGQMEKGKEVGKNGATIEIEHSFNKLCRKQIGIMVQKHLVSGFL